VDDTSSLNIDVHGGGHYADKTAK